MTVHPAFCGLLPHPPIIVPEVGRERLDDCRATLDACGDFARRMVAARPERLFMVSPHSPRQHSAFGLWAGERLRGDLGRFGAPRSAVDLPNDPEMGQALSNACESLGLGTWHIPEEPLDHGAVVPLWFLVEAGWQGPTCIASLPWNATPRVMEAFGRALAQAAGRLAGRAALIASGDMSHKVKPDAPAGYHPRAVEFDHALTQLVREGRLDAIGDINSELRHLAAEDAADTSQIVSAAIGYKPNRPEVISYEHPFGVGYLVAVFHDGGGEPPS